MIGAYLAFTATLIAFGFFTAALWRDTRRPKMPEGSLCFSLDQRRALRRALVLSRWQLTHEFADRWPRVDIDNLLDALDDEPAELTR